MRQKMFLYLMIVLIFGLLTIPTFGAETLYKVAVLPFDDGSIKGSERWWSNSWEVGKGISDELVTALLNTKKFRVIEREQIDKVLKEQDFGASGKVDAKSAAKIGKILGVQFLVMGRVTEFSNNTKSGALGLGQQGVGIGVKSTISRVVIDARIVDTSSAEIKSAVTGKGEKTNTNLGLVVNWNAIAFGSDEFKKTNLGIALRDAVNKVANGLAANAYQGTAVLSSGITAIVYYSKENTVIINAGQTDGVQVGMVFLVDHVIDTVKDPDTGEVVDEITEPVAEITVTTVKEKTSTCTVTKRIGSKYQITIKDKAKQK